MDPREFEHTRPFITLGQFYQVLGRHLFGGDWQGAEFLTPLTVSFEQATEMKEEAQRQRRWLEERGRRSDDEFVRQSLLLNNLTGYLDLDAADDPGDAAAYRLTLGKLDRLIDYLGRCPPLDDRAAYETQFRSYQRDRDVRGLMRMWLSDGAITATYAGKRARESIPAEMWGAGYVEFDVESGSALIGEPCRRFDRLEFPRVELAKLLANRTASSVRRKRTAEAQAQDLLVHIMQTEQRQTKTATFERIKQQIPLIGGKAFERAWRSACSITDSGWDRPGRPRRS